MPDHRSYQDPFYGWTVPKAISLCVQTLKECNSLSSKAIQILISSKIQIFYGLVLFLKVVYFINFM